MLGLLPEKFLFKLVKQNPALRNQHLAMFDSQNKRKNLHVFGKVDVGEICLKDGWKVNELEPHIVL